MPLILPFKITFNGLRVIRFAINVFFTPSPSGITFVAHQQVIFSIPTNKRRNFPVAVSKRRPVTVYIRWGTLVIHAAIMDNKLALGVLA